MDKGIIAITGAGGFIGSALLTHLRNSGYRVIALKRTVAGDAEPLQERFFDLQQVPAAGLLKGVEVLIHCAFIGAEAHSEADQINYAGTKLLVKNARVHGVQKIIFFSS